VSYVDAGYALALSVLFLYAASLFFRRRSLERAVDLSPPPSDVVDGVGETGAAIRP
jgi:hypothetical protein